MYVSENGERFVIVHSGASSCEVALQWVSAEMRMNEHIDARFNRCALRGDRGTERGGVARKVPAVAAAALIF